MARITVTGSSLLDSDQRVTTTFTPAPEDMEYEGPEHQGLRWLTTDAIYALQSMGDLDGLRSLRYALNLAIDDLERG